MCQLATNHNKHVPSKSCVDLLQDKSTDVSCYSDEEGFDGLDYEYAYLAFDLEKFPKLNYLLFKNDVFLILVLSHCLFHILIEHVYVYWLFNVFLIFKQIYLFYT